MRYLNYRADVRHMVGDTVGPDRFGAYYRATTADFDGDRTRVGFRPLRTEELRALAAGQPMPPLEGAAT